jgi:hypothetical protein
LRAIEASKHNENFSLQSFHQSNAGGRRREIQEKGMKYQSD